jgi:DNA-binding transcriptional LysR family regulator
MDTTLLRCFLAVADAQSFSVAARRLNLSQSTVSHQIARLEDHLGKQLFERTTRSCILTTEGRDLIDHAAKVLRSVDELEQQFKPSLLKGTLVIGVPDDYYLFSSVTAALKRFMAEKPGIAVEMRAGLAADHLRDLRGRDIDLAIVREIGVNSEDALRREKLVWITAMGWSMPDDGVVPLALVGGPCAYKRTATTTLDSHGVPWKCQFTCTSLEGVLAVVRDGLAVSVVAVGDSKKGVQAIDFDSRLPQLPTSSLSIRYADKDPTLAAKALARTMAAVLAQA